MKLNKIGCYGWDAIYCKKIAAILSKKPNFLRYRLSHLWSTFVVPMLLDYKRALLAKSSIVH